MRVLIACEFSGMVRTAFESRGHYAVSCDFLPTEIPGRHEQGDVREFLRSHRPFSYDLMIAFPPCTYLAVSGARWFKDRQKEQADAVAFVKMLSECLIKRIAIENPIGVLSTKWRKPDQIIQPWQFGHCESKATCLWLRELPKLVPTDVLPGPYKGRVHYESPGSDRWKRRSRTLRGIANAMAEQWGGRK